MSGDEIQRTLSQAKISNSNQQKVIDSVMAHLNTNNQLLKTSLFAETDQKIFLKLLATSKKPNTKRV